MKISEITLAHFLMETCEDMKQEHFALLQPYRQKYYKAGHVYLAIGFERNTLMVEYALNTGKTNKGDWAAKIIELAKAQKNDAIQLSTANEAVKDICKRFGGVKIDKPEFVG